MASQYQDVYRFWKDHPLDFWAEAAKQVDWIKPPQTVFDEKAGVYGRWFAGGTLNTCALALDRHIAEGRGDRLALIYDSPVTGLKRTYTYRELLDRDGPLAGVLTEPGRRKGDRVVIYMPMVPRRWWPCSPARASARCTPSCSAASPPTNWRPHRRRGAEGDPDRVVRHRGQPDGRLQAARRRGHHAGRRTSPTNCVVLQRPRPVPRG